MLTPHFDHQEATSGRCYRYVGLVSRQHGSLHQFESNIGGLYGAEGWLADNVSITLTLHVSSNFCADVDPSYCHYSPTCTTTFFRLSPIRILSNSPQINCIYLSPVADKSVGILSSSMFGGMMFGAVGWGTCASRHNLVMTHLD